MNCINLQSDIISICGSQMKKMEVKSSWMSFNTSKMVDSVCKSFPKGEVAASSSSEPVK